MRLLLDNPLVWCGRAGRQRVLGDAYFHPVDHFSMELAGSARLPTLKERFPTEIVRPGVLQLALSIFNCSLSAPCQGSAPIIGGIHSSPYRVREGRRGLEPQIGEFPFKGLDGREKKGFHPDGSRSVYVPAVVVDEEYVLGS